MAGQAAAWPLLFLISFSFPATARSAGAEEGEALLRFKATLPSLEAALPSWIPGPAPCFINRTNWAGVHCFNSHVWAIQLEKMGLAGRLNLEPLAALSGLRVISFVGNRLEGPLPELKRLGALKAVYLSLNNFSGRIPDDAFAGMSSLKKLFLSNNGFDGPIPLSLSRLEKLAEVRLDHNKFAGRLPEFFQPGIQVVDVSFNALEGAIPTVLGGMDPAFFRGNPMLCGSPLTVACNRKIQPKHRFSGGRLALIIIACIAAFLLLLILLLAIRWRQQAKVIDRPSLKKSTTKHANDTAKKLELQAINQPATAAVSASPGGRKGGDYGRLAFVRNGGERFELHDLLRASAEVLGSGDFGSSFKAVLSAGPAVVVKRFKEMNRIGREEFGEHMRRLGRLAHPNLLPLLAYYYKREEKLLVTEFVANGSLAHMLHGGRASTQPPLGWPARLKIVKGVARGLGYLYGELSMLSLPHGHLKSSNVLLSETLEPLLTDYALVPVMNVAHAAQVMVAYKSPEVARHGRPSRRSDVWSLGILILEILTGKFPADFLHRGSGGGDLAAWVSSVRQEEGKKEVFDAAIREAGNGEGEMRRLLKIGLQCCEENVDRRLDMEEALERIEQLKEED